ncbi:MAG: protein translocase subunit SecD [Gammaproteobacteria bacterium]|nr:MAG: protein translocase subunit SecD [Gammaproteobacteria bacterium]RLA49349.1 MAG: protein translocase subunit SecD [Gammaproteobacteria bacterium]
MNRYPLWKYLLIATVVVLGFTYATPNLYAPDPAIQISGQSGAMVMDEIVLKTTLSALDESAIAYFGETLSSKNILVRLESASQQLAAKRVVQQALGLDYVVALNLAPTTPKGLADMGGKPMKLGLDLSGGVHFLLQVDTVSVIVKDLESQLGELKKALREGKIRYKTAQLDENQLEFTFASEERLDAAVSVVRKDFSELLPVSREEGGMHVLSLTLSDSALSEKIDYAVSQNLTTLRNRVNELGVSEPIVQRQGANRIVVELPGVQDTAEAKRIIGKTANLEFRLEAQPGKVVGREEFVFREANARPPKAWLEKSIVISGDRVTNASVGYDENGLPQVNISLDSAGGRAMHYATRKNINRRLGVLFIESKARLETRINEQGEKESVAVPYVEKSIISLATIQSALGVQFRITGLDNPEEASELALLLRAGALAAPMHFVEERTIGPSLGAENIELGVVSVQIGMALVLVFMVVYYRVFGIFADLALVLNLVLLVAVMSLLGATLTLPGIAGIVLTVGMAVDANVLIFSRIREELNNGETIQGAISSGYDRAYVSIVDANLTTLIVAVILYAIGSGPIQGFAVTLSIGILTSMFTAIMGTRALANLIYGGRTVDKLWI